MAKIYPHSYLAHLWLRLSIEESNGGNDLLISWLAEVNISSTQIVELFVLEMLDDTCWSCEIHAKYLRKTHDPYKMMRASQIMSARDEFSWNLFRFLTSRSWSYRVDIRLLVSQRNREASWIKLKSDVISTNPNAESWFQHNNTPVGSLRSHCQSEWLLVVKLVIIWVSLTFRDCVIWRAFSLYLVVERKG